MLKAIDLSQTLEPEAYNLELVKHQAALYALGYQIFLQQRPVVIVFEGWDAAGKGGAIRRITEKLDPRGYVVYSFAAPQGEEATHHYLWRYWRRLPESGQIAIIDRSWYSRVLVDRVENLCSEPEWKRAYREINQFERQLVDFGAIVFKFWLHISPEEQLRRFEDRASDPRLSWKLTDEDWRNRARWPQYEEAANEMLLKTSTVAAPWSVIEGNSKYFARIKILSILVEKLSRELNFDPFAKLAESAAPVSTKEKKQAKDKKKRGKKG